MKASFEQNSQSFSLELTPAGSGKSYRVTMGDRSAEVEIIQAKDGRLDLLINGERVTAYVSSDNAKRWVTVNGQTLILTKSSGTRRSGHAHHHTAGELTAPMPGQVRVVNVSEGDLVTKGQTLLLLEAMKMEIRIQSPFDGKVSSVSVEAGQTVEREQLLVTLQDG